ncbi:DUF6364 family protein [Mucilaginibacter terrae]|uniref:DUF6364 family protein n=1 Tax=Mucilaginibacter terrae TaxID=1955052 RepID=UPI0036289173
MAASKLTLSVEPDLIAKAKRYANKHHISVSKLFSDFVNEKVHQEINDENPVLKKFEHIELSENIKKLTGILKGKVPEDFDLKEAKHEFLKEKYGL